MLIRVVITNFKSYGEETEFNMLPSSNVRRLPWHVHSQNNHTSVLRTAAIYGANAAGKSCLVKALGRLQDMILNGALLPTAFNDANKFTPSTTPVSLEVEFSIAANQYSYGISYRGNICIEEWLYSTLKEKPIPIFERQYNASNNKPTIKLPSPKKDEAKTNLLISLFEDNLLKNNELLLSKYEVIKNDRITDAFHWLTSQLHVIFPQTRSTSIFDDRYSNQQFKAQSESIISSLGLGINELTLKDEDVDSFKQSFAEWPELAQSIDNIVKQNKAGLLETGSFTAAFRREGDKYYVRRVVPQHRVNNNNYNFELKEESDGTQRIFDFLPMMQNVRTQPCTYVIDELDRSLHPSLVRALVAKIVADENMKGQLIFTTHNAGLLDGKTFRNDEIWFAEKDPSNQTTHLYSLDEFKPRADLDIEKGYINGRFGAIPFLAPFNQLNWE